MVTIPIGVIESGEGYVKFPDGTMMQWGNGEILENEHMKHVVFQHRFISRPVVSIIGKWDFEDTLYIVGGAEVDGINIYIKGATYGISKKRSFQWSAIGRWK